ncbi:DUF3000 domain-containing protein [Leucobacter sp. CSA1]|uniref:DUF3000 domain-containing protein n=1 Tax=Leucobacter chromiisoli TaxID=2796471 RepID=A0A934Q7F3_9MICO|nr:DUF3000 domain-containing protein [Leucobacter chromiisoli]MBK0418059.1 DUF3000 domain-containing protein [Leucobacter chromiisoli]
MARISGEPRAFREAAEQLRGARFRSELHVREIAAPERIAPHSVAFAAGVSGGRGDDAEGDSPYGAGRLVLLFDPDSAEEWGGPFRIVCYAQAPLEVEIGIDPFIADVAWSWLIDALESRGARYSYASGTATKTLSSGFGTLESQGEGAQLEVRASWTPEGPGFAAHAEAWSELLCLLAGLPHQEGVDSLGARRARQRAEKAGA